MKPDHAAWLCKAVALLALSCGTPALAANECRVSVGFHEGAGTLRRDQVITIVLSVGDVVARPTERLNFVRNDGPHDLRFVFDRLAPLQLTRGQSDPKVGHFPAGIALKSIECLPAKLAAALTSVSMPVNAGLD